MSDSLRFLSRFLKSPATVGAVLPSSRRLAELLVGPLQLARGDVVVEFGPGTGPMTRVLAERMPPGVEYLGIELDASFCAKLTARYPQLRFCCASAADVGALLAEHRLPRPKLIVSGLPFASLPHDVQRLIVRAIRDVLREDGEFRTFQYVHAYPLASARRFREAMEDEFAHFERLGPVLGNVPPAWVLVYRPSE
jgi:phospholipid N-methyltransferase